MLAFVEFGCENLHQWSFNRLLTQKYIREYNLRANKLKVIKQLLNCMVFVQCKVKGNLRVLAHSLLSNTQPLSYPNLSYLLVTVGA